MKRKLLITNPYNILVFENWLSDLALQGLYPKKIGHIFGEFICDEPLKTDYKIEISNASEKKEQKELYLEQGWKEVVSKDKITIYSRPSEQVEKAAQTFASSQMNTLGNVKRKRDNMFCLLLMWIVASALVIYNILFQSGTPILNLVNEGEQILYYLLADIFLGIIIVKNYKDIFDTYRYLKSGNKVKKPISWKHSKNFSNLLIGFSVPLLIMIFVNGYYLFLNIQYLKDNGEDVYCNKR